MYILTKIKMADPTAIRGDESSVLLTNCSELEVGSRAVLIGPPIAECTDARVIITSPITNIKFIDTLTTRIETESGSIYEITNIGDENTLI
jgi:hypothetical protein